MRKLSIFFTTIILSFTSFLPANAQLQGSFDTLDNVSSSTWETVSNALALTNANMSNVVSVQAFEAPDAIHHGFIIIGLDTPIGSFTLNGPELGPSAGYNWTSTIEVGTGDIEINCATISVGSTGASVSCSADADWATINITGDDIMHVIEIVGMTTGEILLWLHGGDATCVIDEDC